ncbi:uncharacterized protein LOC118732973 [Rhagoletis pomonella]|uniref:uncharacterized protein LOC118732973 n=1 Tax=Rhagoletis pomonella TaxID=28610 RepID=UPI00177B3A9B|nr:uncharacterized protein LOC118732973 [Rhagoletis pomonella]
MDDEKLISLVEKYPMLYDKQNKDFKNKTKKSYVWQRIATILEVDENTVKKRWLLIRDRFGREIRYTQNTSTKRWSLLDQLKFLKNHVVQRPMRQGKRSAQTSKNESSSASVSQSSPIYAKAEYNSEDPLVFFHPESPLEPPACPSPSSTVASFSRPHQMQGKSSDIDVEILKAVKMLQDVCEQKPQRDEIGPEISGFLTMIGATISNLKKMNQARVIQRCTEIVMQAQVEEEEENLIYDNSSAKLV